MVICFMQSQTDREVTYTSDTVFLQVKSHHVCVSCEIKIKLDEAQKNTIPCEGKPRGIHNLCTNPLSLWLHDYKPELNFKQCNAPTIAAHKALALKLSQNKIGRYNCFEWIAYHLPHGYNVTTQYFKVILMYLIWEKMDCTQLLVYLLLHHHHCLGTCSPADTGFSTYTSSCTATSISVWYTYTSSHAATSSYTSSRTTTSTSISLRCTYSFFFRHHQHPRLVHLELGNARLHLLQIHLVPIQFNTAAVCLFYCCQFNAAIICLFYVRLFNTTAIHLFYSCWWTILVQLCASGGQLSTPANCTNGQFTPIRPTCTHGNFFTPVTLPHAHGGSAELSVTLDTPPPPSPNNEKPPPSPDNQKPPPGPKNQKPQPDPKNQKPPPIEKCKSPPSPPNNEEPMSPKNRKQKVSKSNNLADYLHNSKWKDNF
eukprot:jgi/Psemu1/8097/gm1.8097_g